MSELAVTSRVVIPPADLSWSASRASGPGGQNVNKVASKVDLRFDLENSVALSEPAKTRLRALAKNRLDKDGRILITSQATRDQARNLDDAREKLAALIRSALTVPKKRKPTKPSRGVKERRLNDKKQRSERKQSRQRVDSGG